MRGEPTIPLLERTSLGVSHEAVGDGRSPKRNRDEIPSRDCPCACACRSCLCRSGTTPPAGGGTTTPNPTGITLVQQLQAAIAYDEEYLEYHPCTQCYAAYHLNRTQKQLTIALAAAAAGTPFPPRTMENGQVAPITPPYVGTGAPTSASTVAAPSTGPSTTIAKAPTAVREGSGSGAQKSGRAGGSQSAGAEGSRWPVLVVVRRQPALIPARRRPILILARRQPILIPVLLPPKARARDELNAKPVSARIALAGSPFVERSRALPQTLKTFVLGYRRVRAPCQ